MKLFSLLIILFLLPSCLTQQKNIHKSEDHHKIAVALLGQCDNPRALSHLLKAIQFNPRSFLIRHTLATVYYVMGRSDKAKLEFKKILERKPDFTEARVNLARIYLDLNQTDLALRELKTAEKDMTYTNYLKVVSQKGFAYYQKGNYPLAKKWLDEALSLPNGQNCFVYLHLGKTEMALENLKESEQLLKKTLFFCAKEKPLCSEPNYKEYLALAELYMIKKDKKRAKYHLNLFLQKVKKGPEFDKAKKLLKKIS